MSEETLLEFPCQFPIKMMGRDEDGFRDIARQLVEKHTGPVDDSAVQASLSAKGNFVSVTVTVTATSREQLDNIYREVSAHEAVLMAL
jgi:putative lipoic acid-binding regulatory protein